MGYNIKDMVMGCMFFLFLFLLHAYIQLMVIVRLDAVYIHGLAMFQIEAKFISVMMRQQETIKIQHF